MNALPSSVTEAQRVTRAISQAYWRTPDRDRNRLRFIYECEAENFSLTNAAQIDIEYAHRYHRDRLLAALTKHLELADIDVRLILDDEPSGDTARRGWREHVIDALAARRMLKREIAGIRARRVGEMEAADAAADREADRADHAYDCWRDRQMERAR